jgi:hypothetical protein
MSKNYVIGFPRIGRSKKREPLPKKSSGILCEGNRLEAYRFIQENHPEFGIRWLLRRLKVFPNGYYNYLKNKKKNIIICRIPLFRTNAHQFLIYLKKG